MPNLERPLFTTAEVAKFTKLPATTIQNVLRADRGFLQFAAGHPGTGKRRLYSALDVCQFVLLKRFTQGFPAMPLADVRDVIAEIAVKLPTHIVNGLPMWVLILKDEAGQRHAHVDSAFSGIAETIKTEESDVYVLADIGQILTPALKQMKDEVEAK